MIKVLVGSIGMLCSGILGSLLQFTISSTAAIAVTNFAHQDEIALAVSKSEKTVTTPSGVMF